MRTPTAKFAAAAVMCGLVLGLAGLARGAPDVPPAATVKQKARAWSAAELGFQGTLIADGVFFLGPVLTVQGGHFRPIVGVFQLGAGAVLYGKPIPDPVYADTSPLAKPTSTDAMFYLGLGLRLRIFQLVPSLRGRPFDLFVGPMAMVFGSHDLVTFGAAGELGLAVHVKRLRIALVFHGGYQTIMHQYSTPEEYKFHASALLGGSLSLGLQF